MLIHWTMSLVSILVQGYQWSDDCQHDEIKLAKWLLASGLLFILTPLFVYFQVRHAAVSGETFYLSIWNKCLFGCSCVWVCLGAAVFALNFVCASEPLTVMGFWGFMDPILRLVPAMRILTAIYCLCSDIEHHRGRAPVVSMSITV